MYDVHCHLLPFVDDGANSIEDAVNMARISYDNGIRGIIAMPHWVKRGVKKMERILGKKITNTLTVENPLNVINDEHIEIAQPIRYAPPKIGLKKLFKFFKIKQKTG